MSKKQTWYKKLASDIYEKAPEHLKYFVPGLATVAFAQDASESYEAAKKSLKEKDYRRAAGNGLHTFGNILMGAVSLAPVVGGVATMIKTPREIKAILEGTKALRESQIAAESANRIMWAPKDGMYYHVAQRSTTPGSGIFDAEGFYRQGSKEVNGKLLPLKSDVGEARIYLERGTPRYTPEIFQNTDNIIYEIPAESLGLENGVLMETVPSVDLSKATKYLFNPKTRSYTSRPIETSNPKLPKSQRVLVQYTPEENTAFRQQINNFASKYGYEPIGEEVTDPEVLERYARSLIKKHNTFYRGVKLPSRSDKQLWSQLEQALGKDFTEEQALKYMATHAPGGGAGEVYISPFSNVAGFYGNPVEITKPYKLGADRTKWFIEGDFPLVDAAGHREMEYYGTFSGLTDPWNSGRLSGIPLENLTKETVTQWYKPSDYKPNTGGIPREITARNQLLIPQRVHFRAAYGSRDWKIGNPDLIGSHKVTDTPWQFTNITE